MWWIIVMITDWLAQLGNFLVVHSYGKPAGPYPSDVLTEEEDRTMRRLIHPL